MSSPLSVAHESALAHRGVFLPSVQAGFAASHQKQSGQIAPTPTANIFEYDLFTPQLSISYTPDVFGLNRRTQESLVAQEHAVRFQMLATYTTLTANIAVTAIQAAALQNQIDATHQLIDINTNIVKILQYQLDKGYASRVDLAAQQAQLAQTNATLPPLLKQQAQLRDLLATLAGSYPSEAPAGRFDLTTLQLPANLPLSLPSELVAQRPDVLLVADYSDRTAFSGSILMEALGHHTGSEDGMRPAGKVVLNDMARIEPEERGAVFGRRITMDLNGGGRSIANFYFYNGKLYEQSVTISPANGDYNSPYSARFLESLLFNLTRLKEEAGDDAAVIPECGKNIPKFIQ